ncbi:C2H2-type domain-containing protein [Pleurotus pulmonarius]
MDDDHEEPLLNLSDVVHDEPMDDHEQGSSSSHLHVDHPSTSNLHNGYSNPSPSPDRFSGVTNFSVEVLEREIATLLNQNATAASAALLNAAAQQRQASLGSDNEVTEDSSNAEDQIASLGLNIGSLAAMLQAAQAHAAESERSTQALAKGSAFPQHRQDTLRGENEPRPTRSAPAFHSLTAKELSASDSAQNRNHPDASGYLYTSDGEDGNAVETRRTLHVARNSATPSRAASPSIGSGIRTSGADELTDINDIFQHLSTPFATESQTPDSSPVVPHNQPPEASTSSSGQVILSPSNRTPIPPVASTSSLPPTSAPPKRARKKRGQDTVVSHSHICNYEDCSKTFTRRSDLARHQRIHTGERPFICSFDGCGKTFIQRSALHVHSRVHTGEKPHCCEYPGCGRTFGDSSSLARHRRTHTGKRPYKCDNAGCEKTFTRRTTLTQHMRIHDPNWAPDPNVRYSFKSKKRKVGEDTHDLEESMRSISALLHPGHPPTMQAQAPLAAQIASISTEIAAALAQAHAREYQEDNAYTNEEEVFGSGQEVSGPEMIGPNTSGIRGEDPYEEDETDSPRAVEAALLAGDDDDDSDAFPIPLRTRRGKDGIPVLGNKRKR